MTQKPFGILVPQKIQRKVYPRSKIDYEKPYILATILRRVSVIISYYFLNNLGIKPNTITIFSFIIAVTSAFFFINTNFFYGACFACVWVLMDNIDGELARLQNTSSELGMILEKISSDFFYIILFPSLATGLFIEELISIEVTLLIFLNLGLFNILRPFLTNFPFKKTIPFKDMVKNNFFLLIVACQFKNSTDYRRKTVFGSFLFYSWRNLFTQCGLNELVLLIFTIPSFGLVIYLDELLIFFLLGYSIINLILFLSFLIIEKKRN